MTQQPDILFEDDAVLVLDKPSGMLVHRGWANDGPILVDFVRDYLNGTPHPIHRLDRPTSGVILFAKTATAARQLNAQFDARTVQKVYLAMVRGIPPESGLIDNPVPRTEGGERIDAQTRFERVASVVVEPREVALVRAFPLTGRFHQIRRHLKHINHPLIGDANYGKGKLNRAFRSKYGLARLALHAESLGFEHPVSGERLTVRAPLPSDLLGALRAIGFDL